jgi:hypothetical protein
MKFLKIIGLFCIVFYMTVLLGYYLNGGRNSEFLGQVGDFLGGFLNPIFALFSFLAILYMIFIQLQELKISRDELELTRKELEKSADAALKSSKIFEQQRFENTFFAMLHNLNLNIQYFMNNAEYYVIYKRNEKIFKRTISFLHVITTLYQILKFIDNYGETNKVDVSFYGEILKTYLDRDILQLLAISCYSNDKKSILQLINKYKILENLQFKISNIMLVNISKNYCKKENKNSFNDTLREDWKNYIQNCCNYNQ